MLICSECGKTIANTNPKVHHGICPNCDIPEEVYTKPQIKEAVDITIGDDGFRSKEVLEILKVDNEPIPVHDPVGDIRNVKADLLKLFESIDILNQGLVNLDAKLKQLRDEITSKPGPILIPKKVKKEKYVPKVDKITATSVGIRDKENK